jgi:hypothetical protein
MNKWEGRRNLQVTTYTVTNGVHSSLPILSRFCLHVSIDVDTLLVFQSNKHVTQFTHLEMALHFFCALCEAIGSGRMFIDMDCNSIFLIGARSNYVMT